MTTGHPLRRSLERSLRAFGKSLPAAVEGAVEPLHQCRVATRRLRELLPLCVSEVPPAITTRARRRLRRVGRALGPVREIDVSLDLLDELSRRGVVAGETRNRLHEHLEVGRAERREQMLDRLQSVNTRKLERELAEIARALGMRQQTDAWALTLATRMARRAEHLRRAIRAAGPLYVADRVHAVRIAAKKLRYSLECADDAKEAPVRATVREIKEVQDLLGRLHDIDVLASLAQGLDVSHADQPWYEHLEAMRARLERECRELHGRYVAKQTRLFEICELAERTANQTWVDRGGEVLGGPSVRPAGRVLKMRLSDDASVKRKVTRG